MNKEVLRIILGQLLLVIALAVILLIFKGMTAAVSALCGGLAYWLPTLLFVWRVFNKPRGAQEAKRFMVAFAVGEIIKLFLSGILFVLIVSYLPVEPLFVLLGFIGAIVAFWIASMVLLAHDEEVGP